MQALDMDSELALEKGDVTPPVITVDGHDVNVYDSLDELFREIEAIDLLDHRLKVYDSLGRQLVFISEPDRGPIYLKSVTGSAASSAALHRSLLGFFQVVRSPSPRSTTFDDTTDLSDLVDEVLMRSRSKRPSLVQRLVE
jgi:hypothetical protein